LEKFSRQARADAIPQTWRQIWGNVVPTIEMQHELFANAGLKEIDREPIGGIFAMLVAAKE
jgi:hypothetical protein